MPSFQEFFPVRVYTRHDQKNSAISCEYYRACTNAPGGRDRLRRIRRRDDVTGWNNSTVWKGAKPRTTGQDARITTR